MIGPVEILFMLLVLAAWAIPIAVLVWFVKAVNLIRSSLLSIDERLARIESARN